MFSWFAKKANYFKLSKLLQNPVDESGSKVIPKSIEDVKTSLNELFSECSDFVFREILLGKDKPIKLAIVFFSGMVDKELIYQSIIQPITLYQGEDSEIHGSQVVNILKEKLLSVPDTKVETDYNKAVEAILAGDTVIFAEGAKMALKTSTRGWEGRKVEEPQTEAVVRGSREGFCETLAINMTLIRRRLKNPGLKFETLDIGKRTNTTVCICYIKGIVNEDVLNMVRQRLSKIDTDAILESGYIEAFIMDAPLSIFPTVGNSEKPDVVVAKILEGRVAILVDTTPFVLTVPYVLVEAFQASEDYYSQMAFSSFTRFLRLVSFIISTALPALYVALTTFHPNMIPFNLLLTVAASRAEIPYPPFVETLLMILAFEVIREAGVRLPRPIGQTVSIVGTLILGQAAVSAGLASNPIVIVIALTSISSLVLPALAGTQFFLRIFFLVAGNIIGLFGIFLMSVVITVYLCSLRSFGVSYLVPFGPLNIGDLKDTFVRVPLWSMFARPAFLKNDTENKFRLSKKSK